MKKILSTAITLIVGVVLGIGGCLAYQHVSNKDDEPTNSIAAKTESKHRIDIDPSMTETEKQLAVLVNNYFDAIDKFVEDKQRGLDADTANIKGYDAMIWLGSINIAFNPVRTELIRDSILPLVDYYTPIMEEYGITCEFKEKLEKFIS